MNLAILISEFCGGKSDLKVNVRGIDVTVNKKESRASGKCGYDEHNRTVSVVIAALCIALCMLLPFLTVGNQQLGNLLCLMHIPIFICAFLLDWKWAMAAGLIAPLLRTACFGMPPLFPTAIAMALELGTYGCVTSIIYDRLTKKAGRNTVSIYISLIAAMIAGRLVTGAAKAVMLGVAGTPFTFGTFLTVNVVYTLPGAVIQLILVPVIVTALKRAGIGK